MAYTKPSGVNSLWAASGDKTTVPPAKVSAGWVAEKPSFQYFNQILYNLGLYDAYNNERGIPEWDDETEYQATKSYVVGSDGTLYKCATTNTNNDPIVDDGTNWEEVVTGQGSISWNINKQYLEGAVVFYSGKLWVAQSTNTGVTPITSASEWDQVINSSDLVTIEDDITELSTANNARTKAAFNAGGLAPIYACRAWCNFNGTGTPAIRASGNIDSITDFGTGLWGANLVIGIEDANGSAFASAAATLAATPANGTTNVLPCVMASTTQVRVGNADTVGNADAAYISVMVMR